MQTDAAENESENVAGTYTRAYQLFDRGDYMGARNLSDECCSRSSKDSYWYWGALGLRCWLCTFLDDGPGLEETAAKLLSECPAAHRPWFAGLAHLNLALWMARRGEVDRARAEFAAAAVDYDGYEPTAAQPPAWAFIPRYFAAVACWKSGSGVQRLKELRAEFGSREPSVDPPQGLHVAVELACRSAQGLVVSAAVRDALTQGVSRAFLAPLLLDGGNTPAHG